MTGNNFPVIRDPQLSRAFVLQDVSVNRRKPRIQLLLVLFRFAQAMRYPFNEKPKWRSYGPTLIYQLISEWMLGIELPVKTRVGDILAISHGFGLVVNEACVVGNGVTLRHGTTLGTRIPKGGCPTIHDGVDVGANVVILGSVTIGPFSTIGAGSVVLSDVPEMSVAVGNPARVLGGSSSS
ncbi:serine O-acetyltransferase [Williamsia serinedens]|uniref:serine O-acetyltransferase n=1 Tax=Williamsia serinedens TaxID=391736 RepID=UPI0035586FAE